MSKNSFTLFFSYSHADEDLRDNLAEHLSSLKRNKVIDSWHDRKIPAGTKWAKAIDDNLNKADIILLLISSKFLASEYCSDIEVKQAMARHKSNEARVIPIILKACDWSDEEFGELQALPKNAHPVTSWSNQDEAFLDIVKGIKRAILDLRESATTPIVPTPIVQNNVEPVSKTDISPLRLISSNLVVMKRINIESNDTFYLHSAKGIDYRELEKLLKDKQWYEADQLTDRLMLKASGREEDEWINLDSIKNFPCEDLQTIDLLWVHYSNGLYGFSVQKDIYVECGGRLDFSCLDPFIWDEFCDRTGWKEYDDYVAYPNPFFENNFIYMKGHLPYILGWRVRGMTEYSENYLPFERGFEISDIISFLVSRLVKCKP